MGASFACGNDINAKITKSCNMDKIPSPYNVVFVISKLIVLDHVDLVRFYHIGV